MLTTDDKRKQLAIGIMGNILAWYDFALFMPFLPVFSKFFLPPGDAVTTSIVSFFMLAIGLFTRPIGSMIFGPIGDKVGRQKALSLSILFMAVPTFCIGLLPGYDQIGILSPILLLIIRALQGISMGGEYTAAMVHLVELSPKNKRGFFGSFTEAGSQVGIMFAIESVVILYAFFSEAEVYSYAWRYPFFFSVLLIPFAFITNAEEKAKEEKSTNFVFSELMKHKKEVLCLFAITAFSGVSFYTLFTFFPYYLVRESVLTLDNAARCGVIANISVIISSIVSGYLSDIFKRKPFLSLGMVGIAITTCVAFLMGLKSFIFWRIIHAAYGICVGMYFGSRAAFFSEAFDKSVRCTGVSISMSVGQAIAGGLTPMIMNYCTSISRMVSIIPIITITFVGLFALLKIEDRTGKDI